MSLDPAEGVGLVVGGAGGVKLFDLLVTRFFRRAEQAEDSREEAQAEVVKELNSKLDAVLSELHELKSETRADRERAAAVQSALSEVKNRIDGISANHGPKIGALEQEMAALKARVDSVERPRRRPR